MPRARVLCIEKVNLDVKTKKDAEAQMQLLKKNAEDIAVRSCPLMILPISV